MKNIENYINESSATNWYLSTDQMKMIIAAFVAVERTGKDLEVCKAIGVDDTVWQDLMDDIWDELQKQKVSPLKIEKEVKTNSLIKHRR